MTTTANPATVITITLTEEERAQLLNFLQQRLTTKLVEEHRTEAADYREYVVHQEEILETLINKLQRV